MGKVGSFMSEFCTKCCLYKSSKINNMAAWGNPSSRILILGESPGEQEERDGIPFVGDAGKKLWEILAKFGVTRDQCRIVNVLGCRPNKKDKNLDLLSCIPLCRENFLKKLEGCNPAIVITLGDPALFAATGETKISKHRGLHTWDRFPNAKVVSTYHPAYLLYSHNPTAQSDVMEDLSLVFGKKTETAHYYVLGPGEDLTTLLKQVESKGSYSLDVETTSLDWMSARVLCGAVCLDPYAAYTVPLLGRYAADIWTQDDFNLIVKFFQRLLATEANVCGDNIKFDFKCLKFYGAELNPKSFIWSNDLAHHLIREEDPHSLDYLTSQYTDMPLYKDNFLKLVAQNSKRGKRDFSAPPEKDLWIYNAKDADAQLRVARALYPLVKEEGLLGLYETFTEPLIHQTMEWEMHGVLINVPLMNQVKTQLQGENEVLANGIRTEVSLPELNIGSDQQVADLLFNQIGLESLKKTKGKKNSVSDKEVLIKYDDIPLVHNIRNYRKRKTLISLVGGSKKGIPRFLDKNNRVHPEAKIGRAKTGRITYGKPTLQNIPDTKSMRGMIRAPEGYSILSGDYSQIELYISALMSHDTAMLAAVRDDLHNYVAINVLHSPTHIDEGTRKVMADPLFRKKAKTLNFGVCLPMSDEMLTRGGWKKYGEVYIGDVILGYNMLSGRNEWTTVEDIIYNESTPMVEFGNAHTKLKCSIGHRWVDNHRHTGLPKRLGAYSRYYLKKLSAVEDINVESNLILASHSDGGNSDVTENEAAIIAWLMTDGSIKGNSNTIWQKKDNFCKHIEWLLDQEDALASIYVMSSGVLGYHLTSSYSKYLWNKSGLNNVTLDQFILSLNEKSRGAFLLNAYYAEGTVCKKNKSKVITQNAGELLDAIKLAAFLEGYFVSQHRNPSNRYPSSTSQKIILSDPILTGQKIKLRTCGLEPSWCVRTGLGTVIARSDRYMFITGNCYGETEWGLSKSMPCSKDEAIEYIAGFYRRFPMWKRFTEEIANQVYTRQYVEDIYGRRRHIHLTPEMSPMQRAALLREAVNQPIQGTATDILHFAAMRVHKRFKEELGRGLATVLFTHHDAIVCEVRDDVLDRAKYIMLEEMLRPIPQLDNFIPVVDPVTGPCWFSKNDDTFVLEEAEVLDAEEDEEDEDSTTGEEGGNEQP